MEELEAVDWYDQRIDTADDEELRDVLRHNRDEEKEHAAMTLEWLRRHDPQLDRFLRAYLFTDLPITDVEAALEPAATESGDAAEPTGDLGIAGLRGRKESL
jgi:uncharacterized protein